MVVVVIVAVVTSIVNVICRPPTLFFNLFCISPLPTPLAIPSSTLSGWFQSSFTPDKIPPSQSPWPKSANSRHANVANPPRKDEPLKPHPNRPPRHSRRARKRLQLLRRLQNPQLSRLRCRSRSRMETLCPPSPRRSKSRRFRTRTISRLQRGIHLLNLNCYTRLGS